MIHLDTNALIALPLWLRVGHPLIARVGAGEPVAASAIAWYEYLSGPVDAAELRLAESFIERRVLAADAEQVHLAADLYNAAGRKRSLKIDALIAAAAILNGAELLTLNLQDFAPFAARGLRLFA